MPVINQQEILPEKNYFLPEINDSIRISTFRCYISQLTFFYHQKKVKTKTEKVALIDINDSNSLQILLPKKIVFDSISFAIGIDSTTNMSGALEGVLDPTKGMYWTWQSGYINFKIEGSSPRCNTRKNNFTYHIGGYAFPYNSYQPIHFSMAASQNIYIDFNRFFSLINIADTTEVMRPGEKAVSIARQFAQSFYTK